MVCKEDKSALKGWVVGNHLRLCVVKPPENELVFKTLVTMETLGGSHCKFMEASRKPCILRVLVTLA